MPITQQEQSNTSSTQHVQTTKDIQAFDQVEWDLKMREHESRFLRK
jgi:hypothetical protein